MLVKTLQRQFEGIYQISQELSIEDFLITQEMLHRIEGEWLCPRSIHSHRGLLLLSVEDNVLSVGIYLNDRVLKTLHRYDPLLGLHEKNIHDFCIMAEEVSHFLYTTWKARLDRQMTKLEIELQGEVDKFILCTLYARNQRRYPFKQPLKELLFEAFHFENDIPEEAKIRYTTASTFARHYCHFLEQYYLNGNRLPEMMGEIRKFYRLSQTGKIAHINRRTRYH